MTLIIDNFNLKKPFPLDERLTPVLNLVDLPTITDLDSLDAQFLHEGMTIYVVAEKSNYQIQKDPNAPLVYIWNNIGGDAAIALQVGAIDITTVTTILDLSLVTPDIATCHSVVITITDGSTAQISTITNFPANQLITFYAAVNDIVTFVHTEYDTPGNDAIVMEDSFNFDLHGRADGNDSLTLKLDTVKVCQWSSVQFLKRGEISALMASFAPIDDLLSTSTVNPLAANQGRILKSLIDAKADNFLIGPHLQYYGSTQPYTLESLPYNFKVIANNTTFSSAVNAAHTAGIDPNFFRVYYSQGEGSFILPPKVASKNVISNTNNWIQIANGVELPKIAKYLIYPDPALNVVAGTDYYVKFDVNTIVGDTLPIVPNSDGSSTIKVNAKLPDGLYKLTAKINVIAAAAKDLILTMYLTDELGSNAIPLDPSAIIYDQHFESSTGADTLSLNVSTVASCTTGAQNVLVIKLTTGDNFTNTSLASPFCGFLEINKIKPIYVDPNSL
jgi:hypothetical protein